MRITTRIISIALLLLVTPATAWAQTDQDLWWDIHDGSHGVQMSFIDTASITQGTRPSSVRFWSTEAYRTPWPLANSGYVSYTVALDEIDCRTSEFRTLQANAFARNGRVVHMVTEPSDWSFSPPGTVVSFTAVLVCTGQNPSDSPWIHGGNWNPVEQAERTFSAMDAARDAARRN